MANYKLVYNDFVVNFDIPVDHYVLLEFNPWSIEDPNKYVNNLSQTISTAPGLSENSLIILDGMGWCVNENEGWVKILNSFADSIPNRILLLTGKLTEEHNADTFPDLKFGIVRLCYFQHLANLVYDHNLVESGRDPALDIQYLRDKKLYWASTKDIYWRRYFLAGMLNENVVNDSLINYKCLVMDLREEELTSLMRKQQSIQHILHECESINHKVPLPDLDHTVEFQETNVDFYLRSLLGLVIETFYTSSGAFFSEKVFNCIAYKQIFFYVGCKGAVKWLRDQGFYTFDHLFDTSYDDIIDPGERIIAARKTFIDFVKQPLEKIQEIYKLNLRYIEHNFNLFRQKDIVAEAKHSIQNFLNNETTT